VLASDKSLRKKIFIFTQTFSRTNMVEPLLSGIVLGLITVTLAGLFVAAYLQFQRGNSLVF